MDHPGRSASDLWCRHERSAQQITGQSLVGVSVSFLIITFFFIALFFAMPHPLPAMKNIREMPWWAVFGGLVGAVQVFAGLTLVQRVGAGPFMAITVSSALVASLAIDHFGWFGMDVHMINPSRFLGATLLVGGVVFITRK